MATKFYVSRQRYYYSKANIVEVTAGGLDYAGADQLGVRFKELGEGVEHDDPRDAVEAAIAVRNAWRKSWRLLPKKERGPYPQIGTGCTGGMGEEIEGETIAVARAWAEKTFNNLPKCDHCGDLMGREKFTHEFADSDVNFCSERCAEEDHLAMVMPDEDQPEA